MVRLPKAHTDLALPACKIPLDQICLVSYGDASGGNTRAERAQAGYVFMCGDRALLEGMAAPVTLVSCRSHHVKRVVTSASAAEAMGLSEAIAQGDWVRAVTIICTTRQSAVGPSEDRRGAIDLAIIREDCPGRGCSCGGLMERRKWPTP